MASTEQEISDAIQNGTLDDKTSIAELSRRRQNFETQSELLPDIHDRGLLIFNTAIVIDARNAKQAGVPVVSILQRVLDAIGALFIENDRRTAVSVPKSESTAKFEAGVKEATSTKPSNEKEEQPLGNSHGIEDEVMESREPLLDWDEADGSEEDYESESDFGKPSKGKGKRKRGRPKTKPTEEARVAIAVEARRRRLRLTHGTPDSDAKNSKRHLFGPSPECGDISGTLSPTPSISGATRKMKVINPATSSPYLIRGRMSRSRSTVQAEGTPSKPSAHIPSSVANSLRSARPSLIVKLKIQRSLAPKPLLEPAPKRRRQRKLKSEYKSAAIVNSDDESNDMEGTVVVENTQKKTRTTRKPTSKVKTLVFGRNKKEEAAKDDKANVETFEPEASPKNGTARMTRQKRSVMAARGEQPTDTAKIKQDVSMSKQPGPSMMKTPKKAPAAPHPKQDPPKRHRRGAMSTPSGIFEPPPPDMDRSAPDVVPSDPWSDTGVIPGSSPPQINPTPPSRRSSASPSPSTTNTPSVKSPTPHLPKRIAPFPPMSPRALSPFTRGARIALENILDDHRIEPLASLIDLVEELDDTRPLVNDREHVTVMKGGSWIYQVMRDVCDEIEGEDEEEEEEMEANMDIEDVVDKVGVWVGEERERLARVGGGGE